MKATATRIAAVTRAIVIEEGSSAVSMRRVATAVGVTPMALYRHYADRDDLLGAVADAAFDELVESWRERPGSLADDVDALFSEAVDEHLDLALREPRLYEFLFTEERARARRFPEDFWSGGSPTLSLVAQGLEAGMSRGELRREDVWELAMIIAATLHGLVQLRHGGRIGLSEPDFRRLCRTAVGRIVDGIRA